MVRSANEIYVSGTAGDSMSYQRGMAFTTQDKDNDKDASNNCATKLKGGWWFYDCNHANLNGPYLHGNQSTKGSGINWKTWKGHFYSLKGVEMKIRNWRTRRDYTFSSSESNVHNKRTSSQRITLFLLRIAHETYIFEKYLEFFDKLWDCQKNVRRAFDEFWVLEIDFFTSNDVSQALRMIRCFQREHRPHE